MIESQKVIAVEKALRITFSTALKYHWMYGGSEEYPLCDLHKRVLEGKKLPCLLSVPGDIFASLCQLFNIFNEDYWEMVPLFFDKTE